MEAFSSLLALCEGKPSVTGRIPSQKSINVEPWFFSCAGLNKLLNKQSNNRWSETPWAPCNVTVVNLQSFCRSVSDNYQNQTKPFNQKPWKLKPVQEVTFTLNRSLGSYMQRWCRWYIHRIRTHTHTHIYIYIYAYLYIMQSMVVSLIHITIDVEHWCFRWC